MERIACAFCGNESTDRYREVICWEQLRKRGGANKMVARKETGRYACESCLFDIRNGVTPPHPKLFT